MIVANQKSAGIAFVLTFFFGPLGLIYASVAGGIIMIILCAIIGILTLGIGLIIGWVISIIWVMVAVNMYNKKMTKQPK